MKKDKEMSIEKNRIKVIEHLKAGEKSCKDRKLGLEIEHIIVHSETKKSVTYYETNGIADILRKLAASYSDAELDSETNPLTINTEYFTITLEPAAQLEISIAPLFDIAAIEDIYSEFYERLSDICRKFNYEIMNIGYQPSDRVESLPLIPKKRYECMDRYFKLTGDGGIQMMRGTASTQISLDYINEADFVRKMRITYLLTPLIKLITDNVPFFEGEENNRLLRRDDIWHRVDDARCGLVPGLFNDDFGYGKYADFVLNTPLIFKPGENGSSDIYVGEKCANEVYSDITENEIIHALSMVFPDVRAKNYIEVRGADSMEQDMTFAYLAFIKGLFLNDEFIDNVCKYIDCDQFNEKGIENTTKSLATLGWKGSFYGNDVKEYALIAANAAAKCLPDNEKHYLDPLYKLIEKEA